MLRRIHRTSDSVQFFPFTGIRCSASPEYQS
ncbi:hypothetical protein QF026_001377 [Streptomyces aurantiacus]|nr:hypothetical protein [Streptomyces aurantiacus]